MSEPVRLNIIDATHVHVIGLLSVDTVADYQEDGYKALASLGDEVAFDLSEAEVVGSAAIALLISWQRRAIRLGKDFRVVNAPRHLLEMAEVSGVLDILPFQDDGA